MTDVQVSVVIPTFRRPRLLLSAVESVLRQDFQDLEVLIIEDGAGTDLSTIAKNFDDERVRLVAIDHHSGNPGYVRNQALKLTKSSWVAFLDSDDQWLPTHLSRGLAWLDESGEKFLSQASVPRDSEVNQGYGALAPKPIGVRELLNQNSIVTSGVICHRELLEQADLFPEAAGIYEDWGLWLRMSRLTRLFQSAVPTIAYRQQHDSVSHQLNPVTTRYRTLIDFLDWLDQRG